MATIFPLLPVIVIAGVVALVLWAAIRDNRIAAEQLRRLAEQFGLNVEASSASALGLQKLRARGNWRGRPLEFFSYTTGAGKSRTVWCAVAVTPRTADGLTLALQRQGLGTKVLELFGASEIEVGDRAFDDVWFVQTNQPDFLRAALIPELRAKVNALAEAKGVRGLRLMIENGQARYAEQGTFANAALVERLARAAEVVAELADVAEVAAGPRR
ncbi:MAG: hypothetical protein JSR48_11435 [Verrucomicrobia bacterium]|nr:hypothetical protein [Verrucomicrobiota bacterium]